MDTLTNAELKSLLKQQKFPCVSFTLPLDASNFEPNLIRWKNLLARSEEFLTRLMPRAAAAREFLVPAQELLNQPVFWQDPKQGLAAFLMPGTFRTFGFPVALPEAVVAARHLHVKSILPHMHDTERFFILTLSENGAHLLKDSNQALEELPLRNVPDNLAELQAFSDKQEPLEFHGRRTSGGGWGEIFSGQGVGIDDVKDDILRFFQMVNHGVHEHLRREQAPLVLAGVEFLWPLYRQANSYAQLLEQGIPGNPARLTGKELHNRARRLVEPIFEAPRRKAADLYAQFSGTGRTTNDLAEVVSAAFQGKLESLFIAGNQERWGTFDPDGPALAVHDHEQPGDEDLLNVAAVYALQHGSAVYVVDTQEVPGQNEVAALYWLPMDKHQGKRKRQARVAG
ncbi:MAG TPA: hypothetical protein VKS79_25515 [Gemmataceae bacterium]|nr:hypothetical protein [Gemmataceae bacterium]